MHTYPATITPVENGQYMIAFNDVPQALSYGESVELALEWGKDALQEALGQYMEMRLDIPAPSPVQGHAHTVSVEPMMSIKLTIYQAMRDKGINQERLASMLGCDARQVRRLLDIFHNSTLEQLSLALFVLGYRLEMNAAPLGEPAQQYACA